VARGRGAPGNSWPLPAEPAVTFLNPEADRAAGYHAIQSGGDRLGRVVRRVYQGPQKRLAFLPEQHTDFVFPIVGDELGFVGVVVALALFLALFLALVRIARRATDPYSSLVAFGILGLLFTHVFENVGMTVNLMPITGIPLPFFLRRVVFHHLLICLGSRSGWRTTRQSGYPESDNGWEQVWRGAGAPN
jgi:rod shape determining protein RodA